MAFEISFRSVEFTGQVDSVLIEVETDIPCHLFCRLTTEKPRIHTAPVNRRGDSFVSELRFCFVSYEDNEQIEPGDTLSHTWIKPDWPFCVTKWCYFWGYVDGHLSPSTSPVFKFHNDYVVPPLIEVGDPCEKYPGATQENRAYININKPATGTGTITRICFNTPNYPNSHYFYFALMYKVGYKTYKVRSVEAVYSASVGQFTVPVNMEVETGDCLAFWGDWASLRRVTVGGVNLASNFVYTNPLILGASVYFPADAWSNPLALHGDNLPYT